MTTSIQPNPVPGITRREFLTYAWAGSMALLAAQGTGIVLWAALRHEKDYIVLSKEDVPLLGAGPVDFPEASFWLSYSESGLVALHKVCTHSYCSNAQQRYLWVDANFRFECPAHGSKFNIYGGFVEGPALRSLDRYAMTILTRRGNFESNEAGDPIKVDLDSIKEVRVHIKTLIKGPARL